MVGPKRRGCLIARAVNDALASVRAGYFGQPVANPLLCFRTTNTALAVEQMRYQGCEEWFILKTARQRCADVGLP